MSARRKDGHVFDVAESERSIMIATRAAIAARDDARVWRNNVGVDLARGVRYGLAVGSGDLIGIVQGRFLSLEVKKPEDGRTSDEQRAWQRVVRRFGGVAEIVTSAEEAIKILDLVKAGRL